MVVALVTGWVGDSAACECLTRREELAVGCCARPVEGGKRRRRRRERGERGRLRPLQPSGGATAPRKALTGAAGVKVTNARPSSALSYARAEKLIKLVRISYKSWPRLKSYEVL